MKLVQTVYMLRLLRDIFIPTQSVQEPPLAIESLDHFLHQAGLEGAESIRLEQLPLDDGIPLITPQKILSAYVPDLLDIYHHTAITPQDFNDLYYQVLLRFTEYVHLTPASKNYHHSEVGGLLVHSLQVAKHAMAYLKEHESHLSTYLPADKRISQRHHWHYLTFLAGLYHDSGKPLTDMYIHDTQGRVWNAYATPLYKWLRHNHIDYYFVHYYHKRSLKDHLRASHHVFHQTMTDAARFFFSTSHRELLHWFNEIITGNARSDMNFLARCLEHGDMASTRLAFQQGKSRFMLSGSLQWHTLVKEELYLIFTNANVNHPDANVWVANDSVYLVVPDFFQYLSNQLIKKSIHNIPLDHEILIRELNDMGMLTMPANISQQNPVFPATFQVAGQEFEKYVVMLSPVMVHDLSFYLIQQCRIAYPVKDDVTADTVKQSNNVSPEIVPNNTDDDRLIIVSPNSQLTDQEGSQSEINDKVITQDVDMSFSKDSQDEIDSCHGMPDTQDINTSVNTSIDKNTKSNKKRPSKNKGSTKSIVEISKISHDTDTHSIETNAEELLKFLAKGISIPKKHIVKKDYFKLPWPTSAKDYHKSLQEIITELDSYGILYKDRKTPFQYVYPENGFRYIRIKYEYHDYFNIVPKKDASLSKKYERDNTKNQPTITPSNTKDINTNKTEISFIQKRFQELLVERQEELEDTDMYIMVDKKRGYCLKACIEWYRKHYPKDTYYFTRLALSEYLQSGTDYIILEDIYV